MNLHNENNNEVTAKEVEASSVTKSLQPKKKEVPLYHMNKKRAIVCKVRSSGYYLYL
mgnify:CR=1 FL=1